MIFDTKDDLGQVQGNLINFGFDFTPCEYSRSDILYLKIVGVEGKTNVTLLAKYHVLDNYQVFCSKSGVKPPITTFPSVTYTDIGTVFYGGKLLSGEINDKMYILKEELTWDIVDIQGTTKPKARYGGYLTNHNGNLILFGGKTKEEELLKDLWVFSLDKREWYGVDYKNSSNIPSARFNPSGEVLENYGKLVMFGGEEKIGDSRICLLNLAILRELVDNIENQDKIPFSKINSLWSFIDLGKNYK